MIPNDKLEELLKSCTPGAWTLSYRERYLYEINILLGHKSKEGLPYAVVNTSYNCKVESGLANATLMAMAPELAKEVIELRGKIEQFENNIKK